MKVTEGLSGFSGLPTGTCFFVFWLDYSTQKPRWL